MRGRESAEGGRWPVGGGGGRSLGGVKERGQILGNPLEDALLLDARFQEGADELAVIAGILPGGEEGGRNAREVLVEIGDIVNEWERAAVVDEAEAGGRSRANR